jgi:hypothetical protein
MQIEYKDPNTKEWYRLIILPYSGMDLYRVNLLRATWDEISGSYHSFCEYNSKGEEVPYTYGTALHGLCELHPVAYNLLYELFKKGNVTP